MKKLLLITILIGGCATTPPQLELSALERQEMCKINNIGKYWGDCLIKNITNDPNFNKVQQHNLKYYPTTYTQNRTLIIINTGLKRQLESGQITDDEANIQFEEKLILYRKSANEEYARVARKAEEKKQETALAWKQLGEALSSANATLSGNNSVNNQNNRITPAKLKVSFRLQSSYMNGYQKVCVYAYRTHTQTWTTSSAVTCPSTKHFDNPE